MPTSTRYRSRIHAQLKHFMKVRDGSRGAAGPVRCIDPKIGEQVDLSERATAHQGTFATKQKQGHQREVKAAALLRRMPHASALDIGTAAVQGEPRAEKMPRQALASIGLSIGVELVRRGMAAVTRGNRFKLIEALAVKPKESTHAEALANRS